MSQDATSQPGRSFKTAAKTAPSGGSSSKIVRVKVDHKAATREAIIVALRNASVDVRTRSDWKASPAASSEQPDWDYKAIAIHHAGNSYSCAADGAAQMRQAEASDLASFKQLSYHFAVDCQGVVYEALDIRSRGAHIEGGNTGVIGLVFLADFSKRGEAGSHGPGVGKVTEKRGLLAGLREWAGVQNDRMDAVTDEPTEIQLKAASALVKALKKFFPLQALGGHREFAKTHGTSRACPGAYGLLIAEQLRKEFGLSAP